MALQITPQTRILAAVEPVDFRQGIVDLAPFGRQSLGENPFRGELLAFRNRRAAAAKGLAYHGQGIWPSHKRPSGELVAFSA